jgi:hypothetical protein
MNAKMERFFSGCKNPENVFEFQQMMAAGVPVKVERLPTDLLPAVVLLSTIGLRSFQQQIVDDYESLLARMDELFHRDSGAWHDQFWHPELSVVSFICIGGARGEYWMDSNPDCNYMFDVYEELVNAETEEMFKALEAATGRKTKKQTAHARKAS